VSEVVVSTPQSRHSATWAPVGDPNLSISGRGEFQRADSSSLSSTMSFVEPLIIPLSAATNVGSVSAWARLVALNHARPLNMLTGLVRVESVLGVGTLARPRFGVDEILTVTVLADRDEQSVSTGRSPVVGEQTHTLLKSSPRSWVDTILLLRFVF